MSKEIVNNRINYTNIYGRVAAHDELLNQGVLEGSSPTFANLTLTGNAVIQGNLYVEGNTAILNTNVVEFKDSIILINDLETGAGVTLNQSGIEIDRGSLENFRIVYNETNKRVETGIISNLQPVTIRESVPLPNGIMSWNPSTVRIESTNTINIPFTFTSTQNTISPSTGSLTIAGGLGINNDIYMNGKIHLVGSNLVNNSTIYTDPATNTLTLTSPQNINISPSQRIVIPYNIPLTFGSNTNYISSNNLTNALNVFSNGPINLTPTNGNVNIPNQTALTFSTQNEKIYANANNNMIIGSSKDILISPGNGNGTGDKVLIPVNTPLAFSNINQNISANLNNDLIINANNNILLNPGPALDVKIPTNNGLIFGGGGYQRIFADTNNDLNIYSAGDLYFTPTDGQHINIPANIPLTFSNYLQYITGDTNGNLLFFAANQAEFIPPIYAINTLNSTTASNGSIHTNGGIGVTKSIVCESNIIINSQNTSSLQIKNNVNDLLVVNSSDIGKVNIYTGDGTSTNPSLEISDTSLLNAQSLIQFKAAFDNTSGYMIGRGTITENSGRLFTFNIPSYSDYSNLGSKPRFSITTNNTSKELFSVETDTGNILTLGSFSLSNTVNSISASSGSLIVQGGLGVLKNIYTSGKFNITVNDTNAFQILDNSGNIMLNVDSIADQMNINQNMIITTQNINAFSISNRTNTVFNVSTLNNSLVSSLNSILTNTTNSSSVSNGSLVINGGMGLQGNLNVGGDSAFNKNVNLLNNNIINLANPTRAQDAATKAYVDLVKQGLFVKDSVMCATIQPQNLTSDFTPGISIDGYMLVLNDRILLLYQANSVENGIWVVTNSTPSRPLDFQTGTQVSGDFVFIKQGTINSNLGFICNTQAPNDVVNTNPLNFTEFTGLGQVQTGRGLSKIFNQINVNVDNVSIEIESINNFLRISSTAVSTGLLGGSGTPITTNTDQSHVTKLGTISSGVWQGNNIGVPYGGTGRTILPIGNVLFGNGTNSVSTDPNFFYDSTNIRFGLGTNSPSKDIEIKSANTITLLLNADSDANNSNAKPEILLTHSGNYNYYLAVTRNYNEYANNIYPNALVLSNQQADSSSIIQFATNQQSQLTILSNGYVGINTSTPTTTLQVIGTLDVTGLTTFDSTKTSTNSSTAAVIISGGVSIGAPDNSENPFNGGSLTVNGGVAIAKDLYVGGSINAISASSNAFSYMTITATDEAINSTTGCFITLGGITIQCTENAQNVNNGGALLVLGGASFKGNMYIGKTVKALSDTYLGNLYFVSSSTANYIQSPNISRTTNSFLPINFSEYNNTNANILTITDNTVIFNKNTILQIGGTLNTPDGYNIYYTTGNLNVIPNNTNSNYNINVGTIGSFTNLNIYGNSGGQLKWQSTRNNLLVNNSTIQLTKNDSSGSIVLTTPNNSNVSFIQASGSNMTMNIGGNSTGGQLTTILSNDINTSTIAFIPSNITNSSLVLTNNIYSTFNGPTKFSDRLEYSGNALHQSINNTSGNSLWIYFGQINSVGPELGYTEIDFNNGVSVTSGISGLKLTVSISGTTGTFAHSHYGTIPFNSGFKPICYIYNDGINDYQLFVLLPPNSQTNINVSSQNANKFLLINEGTSALPNGTTSNFNNSIWTSAYITNIESTLKYTTGDFTVEGLNLNIADNLPIIGYNNRLTTNERDIGTLYQRYQVANELGNGDIVNPGDAPFYSDSLPNQTGVVSLYQLKLSALASLSDNYYNGMWIKIISGSNINQVRKVTNYNGAQRVITLATPFTLQSPNTGDTVYFYNNSFVANFFDVQNDTFALGYTDNKPNNGTNASYLNITNNANLRLKSLYSTDTTVSTNSSSGSVYLLGGISINNTNDAVSSTYGGTITTRGGVGIQKNLLVGNNIGIGSSAFSPQESLHIRKTTSTMRLEHNTGSYSYLDFVENGSTNRYGVLFDSSINQLCFTNNNSNNSPNNSNKALTINNLGYIGINTTTNVISPLTLNTKNFISTNSSTGYLGLIGAASNSNDNTTAARIQLFANSQTSNTSSGSLKLYGGNNSVSGNVSIFTNNDIERIKVDYNGTVSVFCTSFTDSKTTGALIVSGGVSVLTSQNSTSITSGGSITTLGGVAIGKDVYIGGSLYITGAFSASGSVTAPVIDSSTLAYINCSSFNYYHNNLQLNGSLGVLTLMFTVLPNLASQDTEISFKLPGRSNAFIRSFEVISNCTGYSDTSIIPLFNVLSYGVIGTTNINIKFQSISSNIHYFQLQATYILA